MKYYVYTSRAGDQHCRYIVCVPEGTGQHVYINQPDVKQTWPLVNRLVRSLDSLPDMGINALAMQKSIADKGYYVGTVAGYTPWHLWQPED